MIQNKSEYNIYKIKDILIVLGTILLSKSLYYETYGVNILLIVFLGFLSLVYNVSKIKINKLILLYIFIILVLIMLNLGSRYESLLVLLTNIAIGIFVVHSLSFDKFSNIYVKILLIISFFSIFTWAIIYFNLHSFLPDFVAIDGRQLRNFMLFGVSENFINSSIFRNSGIWWEPGAFQLFVNLAFIFTIINQTINYKKYILFLVTIITISSTTGFIVFFLISGIYFKNITFYSKHKMLFLVIFIGFITLIFLYASENMYDKFNPDSNSFVSFLSRYYDVLISGNMLIDNPVLGYGFGSNKENAIPYGINMLGYDIYNSTAKPTGADGITMFIAQIGLFSLILLIPFLIPKYYKHLSFIDKIVITICLLLMFNTENFTFLLIFIVLTFYGIVGNNKKYRATFTAP